MAVLSERGIGHTVLGRTPAPAVAGMEIRPIAELGAWPATATDIAVAAYLAELRSREVGPVTRALREHMEEVCRHQLRRTLHGGSIDDQTLSRAEPASPPS